MSELRYIGHPFIDVGVATIIAIINRYTDEQIDSPEQITQYHLDVVFTRLAEIYASKTIKNYVGAVVFANFYPFNHMTKEPEDGWVAFMFQFFQSLYIDDVDLPDIQKFRDGFGEVDEDDRCVFSGDAAFARVSRELIPMHIARGAINFNPEGQTELPVAAWCLLAMFAMPFGGLNVSGRLLIMHSHTEPLLRFFAADNFAENAKIFHFAEDSGIWITEKIPKYSFAASRIWYSLDKAINELKRTDSVTAYWFTSSSQDARVEIFHIPSSVLRFVQLAKKVAPESWRMLTSSAEDQGENYKVETKKEVEQQIITRRNYFYEDLLGLPQNASWFLRQYLLRIPKGGKVKKNDPRFKYTILEAKQIVSWELVQLFLERMLHMEKSRIESIRSMGTRLAEYTRHDPRLFRDIFMKRQDWQLRLILLQAANKARLNHQGVLLPLDEFLNVFFADEGETLRSDWRLARDLLLICIIEQLSDEWVTENQDLLENLQTEAVDTD